MGNLLDYLEWRSDLTFRQSPFNEVDNLLLSELSYLDFSGIVPGPGEGTGVALYEVAEAFFARHPVGEKIELGVLLPKELPDILDKMANAPRFRDMRLSCFVDRLDTEHAHQFSAVTIETGDGRLFVAFRGTDDTLAGWREDFYMACMPEVPAQRVAVEYLDLAARQYPRRRLRTGGHSKGGNLAVYAAVFCTPATQRRIEHVWSNDGPGFFDDVLSMPEYRRIADRVTTIIPESSVVGMLLEHDEDCEVVESSQKGMFQHDGFTWEVLGTRFVRSERVSHKSRVNDLVLKEWVRNVPVEKRERFIDTLFDILEASGAITLTDLKEDRAKATEAMVRAMKDMDKETREVLRSAMKILLRSSLKVRIEDWQQEKEHKPWLSALEKMGVLERGDVT